MVGADAGSIARASSGLRSVAVQILTLTRLLVKMLAKDPKGTAMNLTTGLLKRITQTPGQCGGRPCIRGMRIRVSDILEILAENVSVAEVLEDFPDVEIADIQACLLFAVRRTDFPRLTA